MPPAVAPRNVVTEGDCHQVLETLPDSCVDGREGNPGGESQAHQARGPARPDSRVLYAQAVTTDDYPLVPPEVDSLLAAIRRARLSDYQYEALVWAALMKRIDLAQGSDTAPLPVRSRGSRSGTAAHSRRLRRLEERGLLHRLSTTPEGLRTTHMEITDAGIELLEHIRGEARAG